MTGEFQKEEVEADKNRRRRGAWYRPTGGVAVGERQPIRGRAAKQKNVTVVAIGCRRRRCQGGHTWVLTHGHVRAHGQSTAGSKSIKTNAKRNSCFQQKHALLRGWERMDTPEVTGRSQRRREEVWTHTHTHTQTHTHTHTPEAEVTGRSQRRREEV